MAINIFRLLFCFIFLIPGLQSRALDRRFVAPYRDPDSRLFYKPSAGTILQGIEAGHLTLDYARWQVFSTQAEPFLEVAYWIGPTPGVQPTRAEEDRLRLNQYRGVGSERRLPDQWVVMHFHFDMTDRGLFIQNPNSRQIYIKTSAVRIYHGYRSVLAGGNRRVYGEEKTQQDDPNSRRALVAHVEKARGEGAWYLGQSVPKWENRDPRRYPDTTIPERFRNLLAALARSLYDQHIVDAIGLKDIYSIKFDPDHRPSKISGHFPAVKNQYSSAEQYRWSFRPDGRGGFTREIGNVRN